jgi:hypothetical protein
LFSDRRQLIRSGEVGKFEAGQVWFDDEVGRLHPIGVHAVVLNLVAAKQSLNGRCRAHLVRWRVGLILGELELQICSHADGDYKVAALRGQHVGRHIVNESAVDQRLAISMDRHGK